MPYLYITLNVLITFWLQRYCHGVYLLFTPSFFLPKLEISDRIQLKIAFVFMIIQVKAIDTTSGVTATGGLHSNFFMGIANIDSLPTATMILSISYRSHVQYQGARFLLCKVTINVNLQVPPEGYF